MNRFRPVDRQAGYLFLPPVDEWLPENRLTRFIVEVVDGLDISSEEGLHRSRQRGGEFSSRKIERATYDSVAFRFIATGTHDHDTLATSRTLSRRVGESVRVSAGDACETLLKQGTVRLNGVEPSNPSSFSKNRAVALGAGHGNALAVLQLLGRIAAANDRGMPSSGDYGRMADTAATVGGDGADALLHRLPSGSVMSGTGTSPG
jgi:hypothetical protein